MYLYAIFAGQTQAKIRTRSCTEILGMAWSLCHVVRALGRATAHTQMARPKFSDRLRPRACGAQSGGMEVLPAVPL